uniref:HD domain-containing protein n=1 Tax=Chelonoidis abingdonii TaxID=106734 RepID=A0A8C0G1G5_CHEAB
MSKYAAITHPVFTMGPLGAATGSLLQFLTLVRQLKRVPRTGWVYRNVEKPEIMALVTEDKQLNKDSWVQLALVHDIAECTVGDIAPADNIFKEETQQREEAAMTHMTQLLSKT